jgi:23S rRNA (adenine2503-C2)-methyltransferase
MTGLTPDELARALGSPTRARAAWRALSAGDDPALAVAAEARALLPAAPPLAIAARSVSADGTQKLALRLTDGLEVETVLIPTGRRTTVCVSTQVGCARACVFCVTATMGRVRDLIAAEIVDQVLLARSEARAAALPPVTNVVLMGMGEPLDNLEATRRAVDIITHPRALGLAPGRVTLSTVGTSPRAIRALAGMRAELAWSVHAAGDELRRRLVPTTRHTMVELRDAFRDLARPLFVEVALIDGVNDGEGEARALAELLAPLEEVRINLLPLNHGRDGLSPSGRGARFQEILRGSGYFCMVRKARGADANAACGQLVRLNAPERHSSALSSVASSLG